MVEEIVMVECYVCRKNPAKDGSFFCSKECGQKILDERYTAREAADGCGALFGIDRNTTSTGKGALVDLWANEIELTRQKILKDIRAAMAKFPMPYEPGEDKMNTKPDPALFTCDECHVGYTVNKPASHRLFDGEKYLYFCSYSCLAEHEGQPYDEEPETVYVDRLPSPEALGMALHVCDPDVLEYACKVGEASKETGGKKLLERGPNVIKVIEKMWDRDELGLKTKWLDMAERALAVLKPKGGSK